MKDWPSIHGHRLSEPSLNWTAFPAARPTAVPVNTVVTMPAALATVAPSIAPVPSSALPLGTAGWRSYVPGKGPGYKQGDIWVGRLPSGDPVGVDDNRHVLVVGGTRGGKGVSIIVPNLLLWPGSLVVIDPKGENAMVAARRRGRGSEYSRGMGQKVLLLDPFHEVRTPQDDFSDLRVGFNPVDAVIAAGHEAVGEAGRIADAMIVSEASNDPFWEESGRSLLKSIILHVASSPDYSAARNLVTVRKLIAEGKAELRRLIAMNDEEGRAPSAHALLFSEMTRNTAFGGVVSGAGEWFGELERKGEKTFVSIMQVVRTNTEFIEGGMMESCLSKSGFALRDLKNPGAAASLFLCLPQRYVETHFRWLRMMVTLTTSELERVQDRPKFPLLMVLDEFAALKRMRVIENAAAQLAGFGVRMMFVVQTLAQLKDVYKDNWETLVANAGTRIFFCNDDQFTRDYASRLVGETETVREGRSRSATSGVTKGKTKGHSETVSVGESGSVSFGGGRISSSAGWSMGRSSGHSTSESESASASTSAGVSESVQKRALITPDEIGRLFGDPNDPAALVLVSGQQPLYVRRHAYFREKSLRGFYDAHRDHAPPPTRAMADRMAADEREAARVRKLAAARKAEAERRAAAERQRAQDEAAALKNEQNARIAAARRQQEETRLCVQRRRERTISAMLTTGSYGVAGLVLFLASQILF